MPKTLMAPDEYNARGYWESLTLKNFHDELLSSAGSDWRDWTRFDPNWMNSPIANEFACKLRHLIESEYGDAAVFAIKDPRMCRIVPFWLGFLDEAKIAAAAAILFRNPLEVALSLKRRDRIPLTEGLLIWLRNVLDAEHGTRGLSRAFVDYDRLLADWEGVVHQVACELGLNWPRLSSATATEIEDFLDPGLRSNRRGASELASHPLVFEWINSAFRALQTLATDPSRGRSATRELDRIRRDFNASSRVFGTLVARCRSRQRAAERAAQRQSELATTINRQRTQIQEALSEQLKALNHLRAQGAERQARHAAELSEASGALATLRAQSDEEQTRHAAELQATQDELSVIRARLHDQEARYSAELRAARETSDRNSAELEVALQALAQQRQAIRIIEGALAGARRELQDADSFLAELQVLRIHAGRLGPRLATGWAPLALWRALRHLLVQRRRTRACLRCLRESGGLDADWYRSRYPDVAAARVDPVMHYLLHGAYEGRDPNPRFSTRDYTKRHPDAWRSGLDPLSHSLTIGPTRVPPV